jgi:Fe-S cluster assembly protein SufA/iron-sulfur cluster assembly protein
MTNAVDRQKLNEGLLKVTEEARAHILRVIGENDGVRLEIRAGKGCGGNEYDFSLVGAGKADALDLYVDLAENRRLYVRPMDFFTKLSGVTIDFKADDVGNRRIHILNPNEKGRCGCGESVSF